MLLYLTSNQKSGLIDGVTREMLMPSKKLVGKFSLKSFVTKDMRNYATAKFFLIDAACIEESGEDFALALRSFQMMFSARIIVILSGCEDMSGCIQQLLSIGVVNLITAETLEDAADELREALSDEGMQRYVSSAPGIKPAGTPTGTGAGTGGRDYPLPLERQKCPYCRCWGTAQKWCDGDGVQSGGVAYCQRRRGGLH